jgi:hypothetical protein
MAPLLAAQVRPIVTQERAVVQTSTTHTSLTVPYQSPTHAEYDRRRRTRRIASSTFYPGQVCQLPTTIVTTTCTETDSPADRLAVTDGHKQGRQHSRAAMLLWERRLCLSGSQRKTLRGARAQCVQGRPVGPGTLFPVTAFFLDTMRQHLLLLLLPLLRLPVSLLV